MRRILIYALWGAMLSLLTAMFLPNVIPSLGVGASFAVVVAVAMFVGDLLKKGTREIKTYGNTLVRLVLWFAIYLIPGAGVVTILSAFGIFTLPHGFLTALAMMVLPSLPTLNEFVDLSWLRRD